MATWLPLCPGLDHESDHRSNCDVPSMKLIPFLFVILKIPVRTAFGTIRIGVGFIVRMGKSGWIALLIFLPAAMFVLWLAMG